jgi:ankyrin repeat protein
VFPFVIDLICSETDVSPVRQNGHAKVIGSLVKYGASVNRICGNGSTSLYVACQNGHEATVEQLLKAGADTEQIFGSGYRALYIGSFSPTHSHELSTGYIDEYSRSFP